MEKIYEKEIKRERIIKFAGVCILATGVLLGVKSPNNSSENDIEVVPTFDDNAIISYYNFELPSEYHFENRDGKQVIVKKSEVVISSFDSNDPSVNYFAQDGYDLIPEYYGYKKITRLRNDIREEQIIKIDAIKVVDEYGNITYKAPEGYELGIRYKLIKYVEEVIYLDDYINENNELDENKLILRLNRG